MAPPRVSGVRRLGVLLQQAREPVFVLDDQRRLVFVNRAWESLTGYHADSVAGLECVAAGPLGEGDPSPVGLGNSFCPPSESLGGRPSGCVTLIVHRSGERLWRRLEFWPYHEERGGLVGILGMVRPVESSPQVAEGESLRLRAELAAVRERCRERYKIASLIGNGPAHRRILEQVRAAASVQVAVLVVGEAGTGRRMVARMIHGLARGDSAPLLHFDCEALSSEALERGLFAHCTSPNEVSGSTSDRSPNPTLLLLEADELPRDLQTRLAIMVDQGGFRLLATSRVEPEHALATDRLRPDLYHLLTTFLIRLPALRDRLDELPILAQHLLERRNLRAGGRHAGFDADALAVLADYDWPGNLRELDRVIDSASARAEGELIRAADLPAAIRGHLGASYLPPRTPPARTPLDSTLMRVERRLIERALGQARQNKSRAAELLDISRPRLYRRIKELDIPDEPEATGGPPSNES